MIDFPNGTLISFCPSALIEASFFGPLIRFTVRGCSDEITNGLEDKLWDKIGIMLQTSSFGEIIDPPAEREYAVEPVDVEIINPSALSS